MMPRIALLFVLLAAGCAATPHAPDANASTQAAPTAQALKISTRIWGPGASLWEPRSLGFGRLEFAQVEPLAGATCVARNDRGTWKLVTPGTLEIPPGGGKLIIECSMAGYETAKVELSCVTPRSRDTMHGAMAGLQLAAALGPAAVYAAPAVVIGALAGSTALGAAVGSTSAAPDADICRYFPASGALDLWMRKK